MIVCNFMGFVLSNFIKITSNCQCIEKIFSHTILVTTVTASHALLSNGEHSSETITAKNNKPQIKFKKSAVRRRYYGKQII